VWIGVISKVTTKPSFSVARFRVKKKIKSHNLERTVSDLSGRVDELEQEAADLRRENGWLKEIVVLKSGGDLAGSSQPASSQDTRGDAGEESEEGGSVEDNK
jgi:basic region leucine zipper protein